MRFFLLSVFLAFYAGAYAQSSSSLGWLPKMTLSHRWADNAWRLTGQVESMQRLWNQPVNEAFRANYDYIRTDVTLVLSYRLNPGLNLALGQMTRFTEGEVVYRTLQQASFARRGTSARLGHRLRMDQTFRPDRDAEYRLRYRFTAELPIKGQNLNDNEWYFKPGVEQLLSLQGGEFGLEQRFLASFGYYFNSGNKLELGLDYRLDDFTDGPGRHRIWQTLTYYLNF